MGRELRYTQQVVAGELAGWQDLHERMGRKAVKEYVKGMVVKERAALDGMLRALRRLRKPIEEVVDVKSGIGISIEQQQGEEATQTVDSGEVDTLLVNGVGLETEPVVNGTRDGEESARVEL